MIVYKALQVFTVYCINVAKNIWITHRNGNTCACIEGGKFGSNIFGGATFDIDVDEGQQWPPHCTHITLHHDP